MAATCFSYKVAISRLFMWELQKENIGAEEQDTKNIRNLILQAIRNFIKGTGHSWF